MKLKNYLVFVLIIGTLKLYGQSQMLNKHVGTSCTENNLYYNLSPHHFPHKSTLTSPFKTAVGLGIESGGGNSIVGPSYKHYFSSNTAYTAELLFGMGSLTTNVLYQHHQELKKGNKVKWYNGGGFSTTFTGNGTAAFIKLMSGLETELPDLPLFISVDWRPTIFLGRTMGGGRFVPSRFGIAVRYTMAD